MHSGAQIKLLESFDKICGEDDLIVYYTHSHYMVNPLWLEKAYIVDNKAIDLSSDDFDQFSTKPNEVEAIRYRQFVSQNPSRTTYFQPVFDALRYKISPLQFRGPAVFLEGKFDFYPFIYLAKRLGVDPALAVFPVNGAGDMGPLISLFRGWAVPFVILLDGDSAGEREAERYRNEYDATVSEILTLGQISPKLKGQPFDFMYADDVSKLIDKLEFAKGRKVKQEPSLLFQYLMATARDEVPLARTLSGFAPVLASVTERLGLKQSRPSKPRPKKANARGGGKPKASPAT